MSPQGTAAYDGLTDLPPLVERAVSIAREQGFPYSCRPEQGRLLFALAAGAELIGETGTGCGVGLAWLAAGARPDARLVSVELDAERARLSAELFAGLPQVTVIHGDWPEICRAGPFDLVALDGGAHGKSGGIPADPEVLLGPGGTIVIDDLTPAADWPPRFAGQVDEARMYWLTHPGLDAAELRLAPDLAALVVTRRFPAGPAAPQQHPVTTTPGQLPSRRFSGAPGRNVMWSNVAAHPSPAGDWARKPTRTRSAASPERVK